MLLKINSIDNEGTNCVSPLGTTRNQQKEQDGASGSRCKQVAVGRVACEKENSEAIKLFILVSKRVFLLLLFDSAFI